MLRVNAAGRLAIGLVLVLAPEWMARRWIGRDGDRRSVTVFARAIGARDVALAVGALAALSGDGRLARTWALGALVADATDAVATALARDSLPPRAASASIAVAAGAALQDAYAAVRLPRNSA